MREENGHQPLVLAEEMTVLDFWDVLVKHKRLILVGTGGAAALALLYSLLAPRIYTAEAAILAPQEKAIPQGLAAAIPSDLANAVAALDIGSLRPNRDLFVSILKSDTLARAVVEDLDLVRKYDVERVSDALRLLDARRDIEVSKEGVITVSVEDHDPEFAARIANHHVAKLNELLARFATTEAGKQRVFIEKRLRETENSLREAEEALRRFQEKHRMVSIEDQTRAVLEAAGKLKGEIIAAEVRLEVLKEFATEENTEVQRLKREIEELRKKLRELLEGGSTTRPVAAAAVEEGGGGGGASRPPEDGDLSLDVLPELGLELQRLMREVKVQETVYTLLTQQLEQAKIAEARDLPAVQVLDEARPPDRKTRPRTLVNILAGAFTALLTTSLLAFFLEHLEKAKAMRLRRTEAGAEAESLASCPMPQDQG